MLGRTAQLYRSDNGGPWNIVAGYQYPLNQATTNWSHVDTSWPRSGHALVYDPAIDATVLFGGKYEDGYRNETWVWNGSIRSEVISEARPSPREAHMMAYDDSRAAVVLFGGWDGAAGEERGACWPAGERCLCSRPTAIST